jgi:organic hydroperoxide reductase OsmC/OhrA
MIRATDAWGQRLHQDFASMWQAALGRGIVEAIQNYRKRAGMIQEQLGTALVQLVQTQREGEEVRATHQEQLASLVVTAVRTEELADRVTQLAAGMSLPEELTVVATEPASWPEVSMGSVIAACFMLATVFFGGLSLSARTRETKALAEKNRDAARWVYRMAA